jgi:endonuclease/exonuclease/phosphatase family metal-dependent hydrolase
MLLNVATTNILSDLSRWEERGPLLALGLAEAGADIIALQEVNLHPSIVGAHDVRPNGLPPNGVHPNTAAWLAERLNFDYIHLTPKTGKSGREEGIAIISRLPFEAQADLDLKTQDRVAQYVQVRIQDRPLVIANGHFFWQPGDSPERLRQVERLLDWLSPFLDRIPVAACGDFNALPDTKALRRMRVNLASAYAAVHGAEPEYTFPTPLPRSRRAMLHTLLANWRDIRLSELRLKLRGTLDYIFVNDRFRVAASRLILDRPAPSDPGLYPSDHYGLLAILEC